MAEKDCTDCDVKERAKVYRDHLDRGEVLRNAANELRGFSIRKDGIIEHEPTGKKVNPKAFGYRRFAEMKEIFGMNPKDFAREVMLLAAKGVSS